RDLRAFGDDQAGAGALRVIGDGERPRHFALAGAIAGHWRHDQPVWQLQRPKFVRRENVDAFRVVGHGAYDVVGCWKSWRSRDSSVRPSWRGLPAAGGLAGLRAEPLGPMTRGFKARLTPYKPPPAYLLFSSQFGREIKVMFRLRWVSAFIAIIAAFVLLTADA